MTERTTAVPKLSRRDFCTAQPLPFHCKQSVVRNSLGEACFSARESLVPGQPHPTSCYDLQSCLSAVSNPGMAYNYGGSSSAIASGSSLASTSQAPITRSRTGLFLSYRDTVIRSTSNRSQSRFNDKGKGKARAYDFQGADGEEHEGLLGGDRERQENGRHEVIQMNELPPQW